MAGVPFADGRRWLARSARRSVRSLRGSALWVGKATAAGVLAWLVAGVVSSSTTFYAPLVAVLSVHPTVARTFRDTGQRLVGILLGLVAGYLALRVLGVHWWSLGLMLAVVLPLSTWRRLGGQGSQVPIAALLMLLLARDPDVYAEARFLEGALGALAAAVVNLLVVPPLEVRSAESAVSSLRSVLGDVLDQMSRDLGSDSWPDDDRPWADALDDVDARLRRARAAVDKGSESVRFNPRARPVRKRPHAQQQVLVVLEHVAVSVSELGRVITRAADDDRPVDLNGRFRPRLADALHELAGAVSAFGADEPRSDEAGEAAPLDAAEDVLRRLRSDLSGWDKPDLPELLAEGAVLVQVERVLRELRAA